MSNLNAFRYVYSLYIRPQRRQTTQRVNRLIGCVFKRHNRRSIAIRVEAVITVLPVGPGPTPLCIGAISNPDRMHQLSYYSFFAQCEFPVS